MLRLLRIKTLLVNEFGQSAVLVSYREANAQEIIDNFRTSSTQWIISVSMVSEGTDIPRLRVCAHLSTVRTELFFRQVLGRILRLMSGIRNAKAYLITFAEPSLTDFTIRLKEDVPQAIVKFDRFREKPSPQSGPQNLKNSETKEDSKLQDTNISDSNWHFNGPKQTEKDTATNWVPFRLTGQYRQQVFSIF